MKVIRCGIAAATTVVVAFLTISSSSPVDAKAVLASSSYLFVNSVGVNTHFNYPDSPYRSHYAELRDAMKELGISHIRDAINNSKGIHEELWNTLGVRLLAKVDTRTGSGGGQRLQPSGITPLLQGFVAESTPSLLQGIEGPNEYNMLEVNYGYTGWPGELRYYAGLLIDKIRATPQIANTAVIAPSLGYPNTYQRRMGDMSNLGQRVNAHIYPGYMSLAQKIDELKPALAASAPGQLLYISEYGWHDVKNSITQDIDINTWTRYIGRGMAISHKRKDISKAYIYQLVDDYYDPDRKHFDAHHGLISYSMQRTPMYYAVRNIMRIMCDSSSPSALHTLSYSLSGNLDNVSSALYEKRNKVFYAQFWLEKQSYNKNGRIYNPTQSVKMTFQQPISRVKVYLPSDPSRDLVNRGNVPVRKYDNPTSITLQVPDHLMIVEIVPQGVAYPPTPTSCRFRGS